MSASPPKVKDAPGLTWRKCRDGWEARWRARADLAARGYEPKVVRLWRGAELGVNDWNMLSDRCRTLQSEMLVWGRGGSPIMNGFNGTIQSLIACYRSDPDSPYRTKRYRTRLFYDDLCKRLETDCGELQIHDIKARTVLRFHEQWSVDGKVTMAHSILGMLRTLVGFGATILEDGECARLSAVLSKMRFKTPAPRTERMTAEQVIAVRAKAHEMGWPSLALAQALQFELTLRQKDVIGEWVPNAEPGLSLYTHEGMKWLRGLRWEEVSNMVLRHTTSKRQKDIEVDLNNAPMVLEEFAKQGVNYANPMHGPIIIHESTGRPYVAHSFRQLWRKIATAAGIPKAVRNMDSRAGAITEALQSGASLDATRKAATHSNSSMTQRYSRGDTDDVAGVMQLRAANRNKK